MCLTTGVHQILDSRTPSQGSHDIRIRLDRYTLMMLPTDGMRNPELCTGICRYKEIHLLSINCCILNGCLAFI